MTHVVIPDTENVVSSSVMRILELFYDDRLQGDPQGDPTHYLMTTTKRVTLALDLLLQVSQML